MIANRDAVEALELRIDQHYAELKALRGRVLAMKRWEKAAEVDPGDAIEPPPLPVGPPVHTIPPNRFRSW